MKKPLTAGDICMYKENCTDKNKCSLYHPVWVIENNLCPYYFKGNCEMAGKNELCKSKHVKFGETSKYITCEESHLDIFKHDISRLKKKNSQFTIYSSTVKEYGYQPEDLCIAGFKCKLKYCIYHHPKWQ